MSRLESELGVYDVEIGYASGISLVKAGLFFRWAARINLRNLNNEFGGSSQPRVARR